MASSDTLGYPIKKHFYRIHLENAWRAAFGALDMGDFETFLKESADRTYPDAMAQIKKMGAGTSTEAAQIKEAKEYEQLGGIEQYRMVADGLRREGKEYEASAIDALIADLIAAQSKAKAQRKPAEKREPKQKPLVDTSAQRWVYGTKDDVWYLVGQEDRDYAHGLTQERMKAIGRDAAKAEYLSASIARQPTAPPSPQSPPPKKEIPVSMQFGEDFDRIREMIRTDGAKNLEDAKRLITDRSTRLTEADRFELAELLTIAEQGITPSKEPERIHAPVKTKPIFSTTRTRARGKREEESEEGEEQVPTIRKYSFNNLADANYFFKENGEWLREMIRVGVPAWIETHKRATTGALSTQAVFALGNALEYAMIPTLNADARALVAMDIIHKTKWLIVEHGLEYATRDFDWQKQLKFYNSLKIDTEQLKKDVIQAIRKLEFNFGKR